MTGIDKLRDDIGIADRQDTIEHIFICAKAALINSSVEMMREDLYSIISLCDEFVYDVGMVKMKETNQVCAPNEYNSDFHLRQLSARDGIIRAMKKDNDRLVEKHKWISVKDKVPQKYQRVLVTDGKKVCLHYKQSRCTFYDSEGEDLYPTGCHQHECDIMEGKITHWMPLPREPND
jgi:hypothetical protein